MGFRQITRTERRRIKGVEQVITVVSLRTQLSKKGNEVSRDGDGR